MTDFPPISSTSAQVDAEDSLSPESPPTPGSLIHDRSPWVDVTDLVTSAPTGTEQPTCRIDLRYWRYATFTDRSHEPDDVFHRAIAHLERTDL